MRFNSASNLKTLQKNVTTSGVPVKLSGHIVSSSTISFVGTDTILDSNGGFLNAGFRVNDTLTITGSTSNNTDVVVLAVTSGTITVVSGITTEGTSSVTIAESGPGYPVANGAEIRIRAKDTNTGYICIGSSSATALKSGTGHYKLLTAAIETLSVKNLNLIWIDATVSGEGVEILYEA